MHLHSEIEFEAALADASTANAARSLYVDTLGSDIEGSKSCVKTAFDKALALVGTTEEAKHLLLVTACGSEEEKLAFRKILDLTKTHQDLLDIGKWYNVEPSVFRNRENISLIFKKADELEYPKN